MSKLSLLYSYKAPFIFNNVYCALIFRECDRRRTANKTTTRVTFLIFLSAQLYRFADHELGDPASQN